MKTFTRFGARVALGAALAGALSVSAFAHAKLVSADPAAGGVAKAPSMLHLAFSEEIAGKLSGAKVTDAAGKPVAAAPATAEGKTLTVALKAPLTAGTYKVDWRAVASDDGHKTSGTYSFTVK